MKQGLSKEVAGCEEEIIGMNEELVESNRSNSRRIKRQKLSNDHCESQSSAEKRLSEVLHTVEPAIMDSKCNRKDDSNDSTSQLARLPSTPDRPLAVKPRLSLDDGDFFLSRRKLHSLGEDLSRKLSDELMLIIFRWLPKRALVRCAFVCKRWRQIAYDESLWSRLDLSSRVLKSGSLSYVLARGVLALRLAQTDVKEPVFSPACSEIVDGAFNKLQYLDLSMTVVSGEDLAELLKTCHCLLKLSLERCSITQESCYAIAVNTDLEVLNLSMCTGLNESGLKNILSGCKKLSELNLAWTNLNSSALQILSCKAPQTLTRLNISGCGKYLTDKHIHQIARSCPELVELDLSDCTSLTTTCIEYVCSLQNLEHIALSRCYNIGSSSYLLLSNMDSLQYLDVMGLFPDQSLAHLKQNLPNLSINKFLFSSVARPTVGVRRTSIWGLKVRR